MFTILLNPLNYTLSFQQWYSVKFSDGIQRCSVVAYSDIFWMVVRLSSNPNGNFTSDNLLNPLCAFVYFICYFRMECWLWTGKWRPIQMSFWTFWHVLVKLVGVACLADTDNLDAMFRYVQIVKCHCGFRHDLSLQATRSPAGRVRDRSRCALMI